MAQAIPVERILRIDARGDRQFFPGLFEAMFLCQRDAEHAADVGISRLKLNALVETVDRAGRIPALHPRGREILKCKDIRLGLLDRTGEQHVARMPPADIL